MIDTPGLDDEGEVGSLRVGRALRELNRADIAVLWWTRLRHGGRGPRPAQAL